jgi:hypothetical protein
MVAAEWAEKGGRPKLATRGHNGRRLRGEGLAQVVVESGKDGQIVLGGLGSPLELEGGRTQSGGLPGQGMVPVVEQDRRRDAESCSGWESRRDGLGVALSEVTRGGLQCRGDRQVSGGLVRHRD